MLKKRLLALCLIAAFALTGVAYAWWSDTLFITGTVATGDIDPIFTAAVAEDACEAVDPDTTMNVGKTTAVIEEGAKTLTITVENAYPGYNSDVDYTIKNEGTVPVKLRVITSTVDSNLALTNDAAVGVIIGAGQSKDFTLNHTVGDDAAETTTYTYTVQLDFGQFNQP